MHCCARPTAATCLSSAQAEALAVADAKVGGAVDHTTANLGAFRRRGGKAILYEGWADPVVSAYGTSAYYEKVRAAPGSPSATDSFFRLFHGSRHGAVTRTRPLCPDPGHARYTGRGNPDDAASFSCR